jgi:hypothetical protein
MTKKLNLTQKILKLIILTKHFFFGDFEYKNALKSSTISLSFTPRSFHIRFKSRFKDLTFTTFNVLISFQLFLFFHTFFFLSSFLHLTNSYDITRDFQALVFLKILL